MRSVWFWTTRRSIRLDGRQRCRYRPRSAARRKRCITGWAGPGRAHRDSGRKPGLTTDAAARLKVLERENRELRQANEILRKASAYFAQAELDRPFKR